MTETPPLFGALINNPTLEQLGQQPVTWLEQLEPATWIDITGKDPSRRRIITTLLHGNEPSGFIALHRWLRQQHTPEVNLSFLIASVTAARHPPLFSNRMLPGQRDLNRCFRPPFDDPQGQLAQSIIERVKQLKPECLIDIHNTSGTGPSFAVATGKDFQRQALSRYFCRRMIVTDFRLGSLMEVEAGCPIVTIECGGAQDKESENTAFDGIDEVTKSKDLFPEGADHGLEVLQNPIRVELRPEVTIAYHRELLENVDITLWPDIELCNHGTTPRDRCLGWVGLKGLDLLKAEDAAGVNQIQQLLREEKGWLYPAEDLHIFMATTNANIARNDCLFYVLKSSDN